MRPAISFNPDDGSARIEGCSVSIRRGLAKETVLSSLSQFYSHLIDHKNGYEWLNLKGLSFGGYPCCLALCFHSGLLQEMNWGVELPNGNLERGWPTRETSENEIKFIRGVLLGQFSRRFHTGQERFPWGVVWCDFDSKGGCATSGLRYTG